MRSYAKQLKAFLAHSPIKHTDQDVHSLLEELYWCYTETNCLDDSETHSQFQKVYNSMPELSDDKFDEVFAEISRLSIQHEKIAFQAGIKIGVRLAAELLE